MKLTRSKIFDILNNVGFLHLLSDKQFEKFAFRFILGKKLDLKNPQTFTEKLQWLKLYDRKPEYPMMVDKYEVKDYVAKQIGQEYIIPTLGVWDHFDDIDFESLPNQFVLKATHDSGSVVICKDKVTFDYKTAKSKLEKSLKYNFYFTGREWPYKSVKPRIIAEQYLEEANSIELRDYKFYCFNGCPKFCQVISDRSTNECIDFFDMEWIHQEFNGLAVGRPFDKFPTPIPKPIHFEKMKEISEKLSTQIPFLRVDFYCVDGKLFFGELTFYPASGIGNFTPDDWNYKMGELLVLKL